MAREEAMNRQIFTRFFAAPDACAERQCFRLSFRISNHFVWTEREGRWIVIFGGLLIMMGQHARSEALFYHYYCLEDQVPENHLLFVCERVKASYSETGRPSIDPELLLRILLMGYLYGLTTASLQGSRSRSCSIVARCLEAGLVEGPDVARPAPAGPATAAGPKETAGAPLGMTLREW